MSAMEKCINKAEPDDRTLMRRAMMQGVWTQSHIKHFDQDGTELCPWCKQAPESIIHKWWFCPFFQEEREAVWGQCIPCPCKLPIATATAGIAPAPVLSLEAEPYGGVQNACGCERAGCSGVGARCSRACHETSWGHMPGEVEAEARVLALSVGMDVPCPLDALEAALQGHAADNPLPLPAPVQGQPPELPSVYTDGSVRPPKDPQRATAGIGMWVPANAEQNVGLPQVCLDHVCAEQRPEGLEVWGGVPGPRPSSTRIEGWALVVAAHCDGPVHVATDSANACRTASMILNGKIDTEARPWAIRRDGDVWQAFHHAVQARGQGEVSR